MADCIFTSKGVQGTSSAEEAALKASAALEREAQAVQEEADRRILGILDAFWSGEPEALAKAIAALERDQAVQEEADRRVFAIFDAFLSGEPEALAKAMGALRALRLA